MIGATQKLSRIEEDEDEGVVLRVVPVFAEPFPCLELEKDWLRTSKFRVVQLHVFDSCEGSILYCAIKVGVLIELNILILRSYTQAFYGHQHPRDSSS